MIENTASAHSALETKAHVGSDIETLHQIVAEHRVELERKGAADVIVEEKMARMDKAIETMTSRLTGQETKARRPVFGGEGTRVDLEHKGAFERYMRAGDAGGVMAFEVKSGATGPDGGYLVPAALEQQVLNRIAGLSPIRSIAGIQQVASTSLRKAVSPAGAEKGWTSETAPSGSGDPAFLNNLDFATHEIFAQPAATQSMLDDGAVDIETWLGAEVERAFAAAESAAFVNGDGVAKPKGFLAYPTIAQASWSWGNLGFTTTGAAGAFATSNPSDAIIDLTHAVKSAYRQNGAFVMNRKTLSQIRKFRDAQGNYLWAPPAVIGARSTLMNYPVVEAEDMPDIAANSLSIAFGDFARGYLVVDRIGIRALRDPYSAKPYVMFYTTRRVGGGVQDFDAIKLLKFSV